MLAMICHGEVSVFTTTSDPLPVFGIDHSLAEMLRVIRDLPPELQEILSELSG